MAVAAGRKGRWPVSSPSVVFALVFVLLGWTAGHSIVYAILDLISHGHHHHEPDAHGYMGPLKLAAGCGLVLAFGLSLRVFYRHGSFGKWMHEGGISGARKQILLAAILPAAVFVLVEYAERFAAGTGSVPSAQLLVVGVYVQVFVGLLSLGLARLTLRAAGRAIRTAARRPYFRAGRRTVSFVMRDVAVMCPPCPMGGAQAGRAPPRLLSITFC